MSRRRKTRPSRAEAAGPPRPRRALAVALTLGLAGLALALVLARLHVRAHAGLASFCALGETVNCDRVATSRFSVVLGLPVAVWGALGYGLASALAGWGLVRRRPHPGWPAGALFVVAAAAVAASVALALVSKLAIGAWCLLCAGSWAVSVALLGAAWSACRPPGVLAALRADLDAARARPAAAALTALASLAAVVVAAAAYPSYWEPPAESRAPAPRRQGPTAPAPAPRTAVAPREPAGAVTVVEYSDYECPYCARAHDETRAALSARPEVKLVRRHFPLDASCNPAVTQTIHPAACALARAAICAEAQGRFAEMDDALFRNQRERLAPARVAEAVGLDLARFRACVGSPETERRLAADVAAAIRDGVRATPTYVVNGIPSAGRFPVELLPPQERAQGAPR